MLMNWSIFLTSEVWQQVDAIEILQRTGLAGTGLTGQNRRGNVERTDRLIRFTRPRPD